MGPSKGTIKRECTRLIENWEVPQYDSRLMRRLKRTSTASETMEHNCRANAKRKNVGTWGDEVVKNGENSGHVLEEEVDEDYEFFLDKAVFHVSDADVNTSHDSYNDDDTDAQYKMFLENLRETDNSYILKVFAGNQLFCAKYEGQEERLHDSVNSKIHCEGDDEDYQLFLNSSRIEGDSLIYIPESAITIRYGASESEEKNSEVRQNFQVPFEVTELPNSRQVSDDYHVAKKNTHSEVRSDAVDEDWQTYLNSEIRKNSKEKCSAVRKNLQVSDATTEPPNIRQGSDVYLVAKDKRNNEVLRDVDEDWQEFLKFEVRQNLQVSSEAAEPPNAGQASDDYQMAKNKCRSEVLSDVMDEDWQIYLNSEVKKNSEEQGSAVWQNSQVSNEATELPNARQGLFASHVAKHRCNSKELGNIVDENYQLFLKSICANGDNLIYMPENGVRVVYEDECDQSSTDSEPIILDPSQYYLDSPSICQKSCHSSCLADERNHKDSLFRKGLMEELERPYNERELDKLLQVASHERSKVQHREMRHGVTKDRPKEGANNKTSYLKMHRGLQDAINQVREPHKALFLLRGFFYWLKHVPQGGAFQPWLDASCLKMLQNL